MHVNGNPIITGVTKWFLRVTEPKIELAESQKLFSGTDLKQLILPLFFEQLLALMVGVADTLMISYAGEAAVSGVSLTNQFTMIFLYVFTALASGGAVVVSQYVGAKDKVRGDLAAGQLMLISGITSLALMAIVLCFAEAMLRFLFGGVEAEVMSAGMTYIRISAYSYPAIAIYNTGAALYRSLGRTGVTMKISLGMNIINVIGNTIGIFVLQAGVAGVAWPSFISRVFAAVVMTVLCVRNSNTVTLRLKNILTWSGRMIKRILGIAIPNSIENGLFQVSKVVLSSMVALFGTSQIAANGVAQSFWSLSALTGIAMGPAYITVIGRCMGARDSKAADYYMQKMIRITFVASITWNTLITVITPLVLKLYALPESTLRLIMILVILHNVFNAVIFPISGPLPNGLRAAGDVKYTMYVSLFATVVCRVLFSWIFGIVLNMGVIGITLAMACDWCIRAAFFMHRYKKGVWKTFHVI
ncbi:MAG: MATE family efflux transporter [Eubacteriales bacterium]|nr:MATE family efflux transporter [Eubacteriales bacterium]